MWKKRLTSFRMKYEYDESKKSKVEKFTCENPNMFFSMRWFSMYEQYLFEDFKDLAFREFKPKEENLGIHFF